MKNYPLLILVTFASLLLLSCHSNPPATTSEKEEQVDLRNNLVQNQLKFANSRYHAFICYEMTTFKNTNSDRHFGRSYGTEPVSMWDPSGLDVEQWARTVKDAKMEGAVYTTKHTGGFCMWDSKYTDYDVGSSPDPTDIVGEFVRVFREHDLMVGLYYCMLDYHQGIMNGVVTREGIDYIKNQITELLTNYGPIDYIMLDAWSSWPNNPNFDDIPYGEIHDLIKDLQPECLIVNHTYESNLAHAEVPFADAAGRLYTYHPGYNRPTAGSDVIQRDWFWDDDDFFCNKSVKYIMDRLESYNTHNGVYILNAAINTSGEIDQDVIDRLNEVAAIWEKPANIKEAGKNWGYNYDVRENLAFHKPCIQSSLHPYIRDKRAYPRAEIAVDGVTEGDFPMEQTSSTNRENDPWWMVDLQENCRIDELEIFNATDSSRVFLQNFQVEIQDEKHNQVWTTVISQIPDPSVKLDIGGKEGRFVKIWLHDPNCLRLAEVIVKGEVLKTNTRKSISMEKQRVCLTLDLKDDPELIRQYMHHHKKENNWLEINEGIRKSGIQVMDIYLVDNRMFMICEVDKDVDFDTCWNEVGTYPRQDEWAKLMDNFIQAIPGHKVEWVKMEKVYSLPDK